MQKHVTAEEITLTFSLGRSAFINGKVSVALTDSTLQKAHSLGYRLEKLLSEAAAIRR